MVINRPIRLQNYTKVFTEYQGEIVFKLRPTKLQSFHHKDILSQSICKNFQQKLSTNLLRIV